MFFQETEFLNSVIDYDHKVETENLCLDIAYGTDKNFLFGCGISIASILIVNNILQSSYHNQTTSLVSDTASFLTSLMEKIVCLVSASVCATFIHS